MNPGGRALGAPGKHAALGHDEKRKRISRKNLTKRAGLKNQHVVEERPWDSNVPRNALKSEEEPLDAKKGDDTDQKGGASRCLEKGQDR